MLIGLITLPQCTNNVSDLFVLVLPAQATVTGSMRRAVALWHIAYTETLARWNDCEIGGDDGVWSVNGDYVKEKEIIG